MQQPGVIQRAREVYPNYNVNRSTLIRGTFVVAAESDSVSSVESTAPKALLAVDSVTQQSYVDVYKLLLKGNPVLSLSSYTSSSSTPSVLLSQGNRTVQSWTTDQTTISNNSIQFVSSSGTPLVSFSSSADTTKLVTLGTNVTIGTAPLAPNTVVFGNDSSTAYSNIPSLNGIYERKWEFQIHGSPTLRLSRTEVATTTASTSLSNGGLVVTSDKTTATSLDIPSGNLFLGPSNNQWSVLPTLQTHSTQLTNVTYQLPGYKNVTTTGTTVLGQNAHVTGKLWTEDLTKQVTYEVGPSLSDLNLRTTNLSYASGTTTLAGNVIIQGKDVGNTLTPLSYNAATQTTTVAGNVLIQGKDVGNTLTPLSYNAATGTTTVSTDILSLTNLGQSYSNPSPTFTSAGKVLVSVTSIPTLVATIVVPPQSNKTICINLPISVYRLGTCSSPSTPIQHTETLSAVTASYWKDGVLVGSCDVSTDISLSSFTTFTSLGSSFEYHQFVTMIHAKFPPSILSSTSATYQIYVTLSFTYSNNASSLGATITTTTSGWFLNTDLSSRSSGTNVTYTTTAGTNYLATNYTRDLSLTSTVSSYGSGLPSLAIGDFVATNLRVGSLYTTSATIGSVPKLAIQQSLDVGLSGGTTWVRNDVRFMDLTNRSSNATFVQQYLSGNQLSFVHFVNGGRYSFQGYNGSSFIEIAGMSVSSGLTATSLTLGGTMNVGPAITNLQSATTKLSYDSVTDASWMKGTCWVGGTTMGDSSSWNVGSSLSSLTTKLTNVSFANNTTTVSNTFKVGTIDVGLSLTGLTYSSGTTTSTFTGNVSATGNLSAQNGAWTVNSTEFVSTLPLRMRQGNAIALWNAAESNSSSISCLANNCKIESTSGGGLQFVTKRSTSTIWTTAGTSYFPLDVQPEKIVLRTQHGSDGTPTVEITEVGGIDSTGTHEQSLSLFGSLGSATLNATSQAGDLGIIARGEKDASYLNLSVWTTSTPTGLRIGPQGSVLSAGNYTLTGNALTGFTFAGGSIPPICNSLASASSHLTNKQYVDSKAGALSYNSSTSTTTITGNVSFTSAVDLQDLLTKNNRTITTSYLHLGHHVAHDQLATFQESTITQTNVYQMGNWPDSILGQWMFSLTIIPSLNYSLTRTVTIGYNWSSATSVSEFNGLGVKKGNLDGAFLYYEQTFNTRTSEEMQIPLTFNGILISPATASPFNLFLKLSFNSPGGAGLNHALAFKVTVVRVA
jgi:hypothetical protein